jgi:hypothetical protein
MRRFRVKRTTGEPVDIGMIDLGVVDGSWTTRFFVDGKQFAESKIAEAEAAAAEDAAAARFAQDVVTLLIQGIDISEPEQLPDDDL